MRRWIGIVLFVGVALTGCDLSIGNEVDASPNKASKPKTETKAKDEAPAIPQPENTITQNSTSAVLAIVNGQPIFMDRLHADLVQDYGLAIAQQHIADEVVRQALVSQKLPIEVTDEQREEESNSTLSMIFRFSGKLSESQLESLLNQFLAKNRYTRRQWDATITRNVRLGRLAASKVRVKEADLKRAFMHQYDGKLRARHIQIPSMSQAQEIRNKLDKGEKFEELAKKFSTNPSWAADGMLPDIGMRTAPKEVPQTIIKAVRSLKEPGQISNQIQVGTNFHILQLVEIVPPKDVKYEEVKEALKPIVRENKIRRSKQIILQELIKASKIEYVNPTIRKQSKRGQNE